MALILLPHHEFIRVAVEKFLVLGVDLAETDGEILDLEQGHCSASQGRSLWFIVFLRDQGVRVKDG